MTKEPFHEPVLTTEVLRFLGPERGGLFVDCTVGLGGHARALLQAGASRLVGCDRDPEALAIAAGRLAAWGDRIELVHADYRELEAVLDARGLARVDGILADLGISSLQLGAEGRGFSFQRDEPLDMRMDRSGGETVADRLRDVDETELADVIYQYGEERFARRIARAVVAAERRSPIGTTGELAAVVRRAIPRRGYTRIDPATRTFQALRIWVNGELDGLDRFLGAAAGRLQAGGRLAVITFHSLEDRIVKHTFRALASPDGGSPGADEEAGDAGRRRGGGEPARAQRQAAGARADGLRRRTVRGDVMEAFEYAIKKDVRNNPIVREIDRTRQRELWRSAAIAVLLVVVVLFSAWQHFELLRHGYRVEKLQQEYASQQELNRRLRLEIETLRSPARIERLATERLHMIAPALDDAMVIQRVVPPAPPARSIVASR